MGARLRAAAAALILLLGMLPLAAAASQGTSVLGLYIQWQEEGPPSGVAEVYYDQESQKLVVVLEPEARDLEQRLLEQVTDPENLTLRFQEPQPEPPRTDPAARRIRGALALLAGYAGMMGVFLLAMLGRSRLKKHKKEPGKGEAAFSALGEQLWPTPKIPDINRNIKTQEGSQDPESGGNEC